MIENLKPYAETKASGLPWLGEVPAHWELKRLGSVFEERGESNEKRGVTDILSVLKDRGVIPYSEKGRIGNKASDDIGRYKIVRPDDLVLYSMNVIIGSLGISRYTGCLSPVYYVLSQREQANNVRYLALFFQNKQFHESLIRIGNGILAHRMRIPMEKLKAELITLPPPEEQAAIARFLAWATNRLDRAIGAKRRIIALLQEQKQAIIHRAVTQGLDPSVPLKDSGISWLGEIPEHWEVITIGAISELLQTGPFGSQLHQSDYVTGGIPVINPSHLSDGRISHSSGVTIKPEKAAALFRHRLRPNDILIARRGDLGRCAVATALEEGWICGTGSLLLRCKLNIIKPNFLQIVFSSRGMCQMLELSSIGATMANLNEGSVARQRIPLPPLAEQEGIVASIRIRSEIENAAITRLEHEITLLREYRTRLIADVVTGKLDVQEVAARLPEEKEPSIQSDAAGYDGDEAEDDPVSDPIDTEED